MSYSGRMCFLVLLFSLLLLPGCKEERARMGGASKAKPGPNKVVKTEGMLMFHGLDLTNAPRTSRSAELPDLWEERPAGSLSYEMREEVKCVVHQGLDGMVFYVPEKDCFYIQHDPPASSTMTFYGPFEGDPEKVLTL